MKVKSLIELTGLVQFGQVFDVVDDNLDYVTVLANDGAEINLYEDEFEIVE